MKKISLLVLSALGLVGSALTHAAGQPFEGLGIGVMGSGAWMQDKLEVQGKEDGKKVSASVPFKGSAVLPGIDVSYGAPFAEKMVGFIGANYSFGSVNKATVEQKQKGSWLDIATLEITNTLKVALKNHWSIYTGVGVRVYPSVVAYAKVGYHRATQELSSTKSMKLMYYSDELSRSVSSHGLNGIGGGVGLAWAHQNLELRGEYEYVAFKKKTYQDGPAKVEFAPKMHGVNVVAAYRF